MDEGAIEGLSVLPFVAFSGCDISEFFETTAFGLLDSFGRELDED